MKPLPGKTPACCQHLRSQQLPQEAFAAWQGASCLSATVLRFRHLLQVYAASALIEWHGEKADTVPRKIFELGLQSFEGACDYVLTYADFLWGLGDYDNMRALFERALAADAKSKKLWVPLGLNRSKARQPMKATLLPS